MLVLQLLTFLLFVQFKPEEISGIMNDFNEPGFLAPTGLYLGGTKYMVIQGEPGAVIRGKKVIFFILHILIAFSITSISTFDRF